MIILKLRHVVYSSSIIVDPHRSDSMDLGEWRARTWPLPLTLMAVTVPERSMRPSWYSCVLVKGWVVRIDAGKWAVGEGNEGQREGRQWRLSPEAETPHLLRVGECLCDPRYSHTLCRFVCRARARGPCVLVRGRRTMKRAAAYFCCGSSALPPDSRRSPF